MSVRSNDRCGRWRNRTVAFRASDEEVRELDALVSMSGLSKQDYIMRRLLCRDVVVVPSSRVLRAMEDVSREVLWELRRLDDAREAPLELREVMDVLARTLEGLGGPEATPRGCGGRRRHGEHGAGRLTWSSRLRPSTPTGSSSSPAASPRGWWRA